MNVLKNQIKSGIEELLNQHKQQSIHVLTEQLERQHKNMLTLHINSQLETKVYLNVIIMMLTVLVCIFIYSSFKV